MVASEALASSESGSEAASATTSRRRARRALRAAVSVLVSEGHSCYSLAVRRRITDPARAGLRVSQDDAAHGFSVSEGRAVLASGFEWLLNQGWRIPGMSRPPWPGISSGICGGT